MILIIRSVELSMHERTLKKFSEMIDYLTYVDFSLQEKPATSKLPGDSPSARDSDTGSERVLTIVETPEHLSCSQEVLPEEALIPLLSGKGGKKKREKRKRDSMDKIKKKKKSRKSTDPRVAKVNSSNFDDLLARLKKSKNTTSPHSNEDSQQTKSSPELQRSVSVSSNGASPCSQEIMRIQNQSRMKTIVKQRRISFTTIPISPSKLGEDSLHHRTPSPSLTTRSLRHTTDSPETFAVAQTLLDLQSGSNDKNPSP